MSSQEQYTFNKIRYNALGIWKANLEESCNHFPFHCNHFCYVFFFSYPFSPASFFSSTYSTTPLIFIYALMFTVVLMRMFNMTTLHHQFIILNANICNTFHHRIGNERGIQREKKQSGQSIFEVVEIEMTPNALTMHCMVFECFSTFSTYFCAIFYIHLFYSFLLKSITFCH